MDDDHLALAVTGIFLFAVMICSPWSGLIDNGYVVTPATDADIRDATPQETVQVSFWELPPRVMLLSILFSACPVLVFPVEFFFFLKMFSYLGYRKIATAGVFDSRGRSFIYDTVRTNPGVYFNELVRITAMKRATVQYHLAVLKLAGKITALDTRGDTRYFENSGRYSVIEQKVLRSLRNSREREIFVCLMEQPAMTRKDLVEHLGISGATVSWHTGRLADDGLLTVTREGKHARYAISPEVKHSLEKFLTAPPAAMPSRQPGTA